MGCQNCLMLPFGDGAWTPAGQFAQRFTAGIDGLHHDQPTGNPAVLAFPHSGQASKDGRDEFGQVGQCEHGVSPCQLAR